MKDGVTDRLDQKESQWPAAPILRTTLSMANIKSIDTQNIQTQKNQANDNLNRAIWDKIAYHYNTINPEKSTATLSLSQ